MLILKFLRSITQAFYPFSLLFMYILGICFFLFLIWLAQGCHKMTEPTIGRFTHKKEEYYYDSDSGEHGYTTWYYYDYYVNNNKYECKSTLPFRGFRGVPYSEDMIILYNPKKPWKSRVKGLVSKNPKYWQKIQQNSSAYVSPAQQSADRVNYCKYLNKSTKRLDFFMKFMMVFCGVFLFAVMVFIFVTLFDFWFWLKVRV